MDGWVPRDGCQGACFDWMIAESVANGGERQSDLGLGSRFEQMVKLNRGLQKANCRVPGQDISGGNRNQRTFLLKVKAPDRQ